MLLETFEFIRTVIAVICCSLAIKLMDDYLDKDNDCCLSNTINFAEKIGVGSIIYAILLLVFAACLNLLISMPLFFGCYIVGMFNDMGRVFPSKLKGYQECLLMVFLGLIFFGWRMMLFAILFILAIQLFDDVIDKQRDYLTGQRNWAHRFGSLECITIAIIALFTAWNVETHIFPPVFTGAILSYSSILLSEGWLKCWKL